MAELNNDAKKLIEKYQSWQQSLNPKEGTSTLHVDEVASKVASFYEQIRTIIDWKEEHLMRRAAVIRKLKSRFMDADLNNFSVDSIAEPFVLELIRGGYFPNDRIEESKITEVKRILEKYAFFLKNSVEGKKDRHGIRFKATMLEIAACEIEETLAPSTKEMALIEFMFAKMRERIKVSDIAFQKNLLKPEEKDIQIYIAIQQALFKLDTPIITYNLLKYKFLYWNNPMPEQLAAIAQNIYQILYGIEKDLGHPLARKFYAICEKYDTPYLLLGDILASNLEKATADIQEPAFLESAIKDAYKKRLTNLTAKISRAAMYSTISIFVTKILSLLLLEIILSKIFVSHLSIAHLAADVLIPTMLMAAMVVSIKPPSEKNMNLAMIEAMKVVYQKDKIDTYEIRASRKRGLAVTFFLSIIYLAGAALSFGFLYWVLSFFRFPVTSVVINIIFIALILFAGTAVRNRAKELTIEEEKGGFWGFIGDIFFLPITSLGRWMSNKWKKYNAIVVFFNTLIDMPFSAFVEFLERWRYFIKEKKEEIR